MHVSSVDLRAREGDLAVVRASTPSPCAYAGKGARALAEHGTAFARGVACQGMKRLGALLLLAVLTACGSSSPPIPSDLADKLAASDQASAFDFTVPATVRYEAAFESLITRCSDSPSKVESAIDTDAAFLSDNGYPDGMSDWAFMHDMLKARELGQQDCGQLAANLVAATGVNVPGAP